MNYKYIIYGLFLICVIFLSGCMGKQPTIDEYNDEALKMTIDVDEQVIPNQAVKMTLSLKNQVPEDVKNIVVGISDPYGIKINQVDCMNKCKCSVDKSGKVTQTAGCTKYVSCSLYGQPTNIMPGIDNGCYYDSIQSLDEKQIIFALKIPEAGEIEGGERTFEPKLTLEYDYSGQSIFYVPILRSDMTSTNKKLQLTQSFGPIHTKIERGHSTSDKEWEEEGNVFSIVMTVEDVVHPSVTENLKTPTEIKKNDFKVYFSHLYTGGEEDLGRCDLTNYDGKNKLDYYTIKTDEITLPLASSLICALKAEENLKSPAIDGSVRVDYSYRYTYVETKPINLVTELT